MKDLINIQIKDNQQLVSARDLYKGLELKGRFSRWFKINSEFFTENEDFYKCTSSTIVGNGIQHKIHDQWILYKAYMSKGYVTTKVFTFKDSKGRDRAKPATYWTQKGRKLIYDVLKREEILPLIERDDIAQR